MNLPKSIDERCTFDDSMRICDLEPESALGNVNFVPE
jgi:hypothetical protein